MPLTATSPQTGARPKRAGGLRLDPTRDQDLREAALELVAEIGYDRLTIDMVAARAGAGKATVYRRWANKAELVADALLRRHTEYEVPDTGSLRGDLIALRDLVFAGGDSPYGTRLVSGMVSAMLADSELRQALASFATPPEQAITAVIERAVQRGEIAEPSDPALIAAILPALSLHRLIFTGQRPDRRFVDTVIDEVVLRVLGRPEASTDDDRR
jgi:AcrR family transcriptional regulator